MIQGDARSARLFQPGCIPDFASSERPSDLLCQSLVVSKFVEDGLMKQILDIFGVVEGGGGCGCLGSLFLAARLAGVDAFVDA